MRKRIIGQAVGALISASYTAADIWFNVQTIFPHWDWRWQGLIGFLLFAGCLIGIIVDRQIEINRLRSGRPNMIIGNRATASLVDHPSTSELDVKFRLLYRNDGAKSAYQTRFRVGFAPIDSPQDFKPFLEHDFVNPIDPGGDLEHGSDITVRQKYSRDAQSKMNVDAPLGWLVYCAVRYSDSGQGGNFYEDERWFAYMLGSNLSHATAQQKSALEPYVRQAYPPEN